MKRAMRFYYSFLSFFFLLFTGYEPGEYEGRLSPGLYRYEFPKETILIFLTAVLIFLISAKMIIGKVRI